MNFVTFSSAGFANLKPKFPVLNYITLWCLRQAAKQGRRPRTAGRSPWPSSSSRSLPWARHQRWSCRWRRTSACSPPSALCILDESLVANVQRIAVEVVASGDPFHCGGFPDIRQADHYRDDIELEGRLPSIRCWMSILLHVPVFLTWIVSRRLSISTLAMKRLGCWRMFRL